jgi:hypothetical protein
MARAGHSDFKTTQGYIDLAGETFREEEALLEARLFGQNPGRSSCGVAGSDNGEPCHDGAFPCKEAFPTAGVGFEPTSDLAAANGFQDRPVRPLRHPAGPQRS